MSAVKYTISKALQYFGSDCITAFQQMGNCNSLSGTHQTHLASIICYLPNVKFNPNINISYITFHEDESVHKV